MATRFRPNNAGIRELARSAEMRAFIGRKADATAARARSLAPRETGEYIESIESSTETTAEGVVGVVTAGSDHAIYVEFGTRDTPTFSPLRRALRAEVGPLRRR